MFLFVFCFVIYMILLYMYVIIIISQIRTLLNFPYTRLKVIILSFYPR